MTATYDVAILTAAPYLEARPDDWYVSQIHEEERLLGDALRARGLSVVRADWADPAFDWKQVRAAVFRSTWDYFDRFPEFSAWLERAARETRLINSVELIRWNMDKHYLGDLARAGVAVVPTRYVERGEAANLAEIARTSGWEEIVVKPVVSGAARLTFRCPAGETAALQPTFDSCVAEESMMIQPLQTEILTTGEVSLIVADGRFTHGIRKTPKPGDFRVQDDHGGKVHSYTPTPEEIRFAEQAVAACPTLPAYARVDFVVTPGGCRLMELELVEPELFCRFHPEAAGPLADAIAARL